TEPAGGTRGPRQRRSSQGASHVSPPQKAPARLERTKRMPPLTRTRTVTWENPLRTAEASKTMSGLELLRAINAGELPLPPILVLLGISSVEVSKGQVEFKVVPAEYHYNPLGVVHGGLAATVLDSAMGCAVDSTLPVGMIFTTLELKINFV